jgi:hypothetical protein
VVNSVAEAGRGLCCQRIGSVKAPSADGDGARGPITQRAQAIDLDCPGTSGDARANEQAHCARVLCRVHVQQPIGTASRGKAYARHVLGIVLVDPEARRSHVISRAISVRIARLCDQVGKEIMYWKVGWVSKVQGGKQFSVYSRVVPDCQLPSRPQKLYLSRRAIHQAYPEGFISV